MSSVIDKRSEILFIYEVKDANPNGDPLEDNAPRTDPETGVATVTDVRVKRWIRDYWKNNLGKEIWIDVQEHEDGSLFQGFERFQDLMKKNGRKVDDLKAKNDLIDFALETWIDVRAFGCVMPTGIKYNKNKATADKAGKGYTVQRTGAVQLGGFSRSFHRVEPQFIQGTAAFPSKAGTMQRSFREDYILPYALIGTYGVINDISAQETGFTDDDRNLLFKGLWDGLNDLVTRSKIGHHPLLMVEVRYTDSTRIGDLTDYVKMVKNDPKMEDVKIRGLKDFTLDITDLAKRLDEIKDSVEMVRVKVDPRLRFIGEVKELPKPIKF